jgi:hypothetical protein
MKNRHKGNPDCYLVVRFVATPGHTSCAGPQIRFSNMRIPARFVLATSAEAVRIITETFTTSAAIVGAMSVGIMHATFDSALQFCPGNCYWRQHQRARSTNPQPMYWSTSSVVSKLAGH